MNNKKAFMQKLPILDRATFLTIPLLITTLSAHAMGRDTLQPLNDNPNKPILTSLPNDIYSEIFSYCHANGSNEADTLEKSMKYFMQMNFVCKKFKHILSLQMIGEFCKKYSVEIKNDALFKVLKKMIDPLYREMKIPASILIFADADANITGTYQNDYLLERAIFYNDYDFAKILCEHKANPNIYTHSFGFSFFYTKTKALAELLVAHGLDVHATNERCSCNANALWTAIGAEYPVELMAYYLELGVNPRLLWSEDNCLFHQFTNPYGSGINDIDSFLKKATLLLDAMPDMINHQNEEKKTPLDCAYKSLRWAKQMGAAPKAFKKLIALFRKRGALRTQELEKQKTV